MKPFLLCLVIDLSSELSLALLLKPKPALASHPSHASTQFCVAVKSFLLCLAIDLRSELSLALLELNLLCLGFHICPELGLILALLGTCTSGTSPAGLSAAMQVRRVAMAETCCNADASICPRC